MNLWILTEEHPKIEVLKQILNKFARDRNFCGFIDNLRILPVLKNGKFSFTYELIGFRCNKVDKIFIKTVSGHSSFVDFLVFFQYDYVINPINTNYANSNYQTKNRDKLATIEVLITNYIPQTKEPLQLPLIPTGKDYNEIYRQQRNLT